VTAAQSLRSPAAKLRSSRTGQSLRQHAGTSLTNSGNAALARRSPTRDHEIWARAQKLVVRGQAIPAGGQHRYCPAGIWPLQVAAGWGQAVAAAPAAVLGPRPALRSPAGLPSDDPGFPRSGG
jgi:hypothetical protein